MHERARKQAHQPPSVAIGWVAYFRSQSEVTITANTVSLHRTNVQCDILISNGQIMHANLSYRVRFEYSMTLSTTKIVSMVNYKLDLDEVLTNNSAGGSPALLFVNVFIINPL